MSQRVPVQGDSGHRDRDLREPRTHGPGTITWEEHLLAWEGYRKRYGSTQSAERIAQRGGFGYGELVLFLGSDPKTWEPR